jgi:hypothetical protein
MSVQVNGTTGVSLVTGIGDSTAFDARYSSSMPNFTASTTSNLISASLGTGKVDFRNAVLTTGTPVEYNVTSTLTLAMNNTSASLGATTAVAASLIYVIVYNAGAPQLAVCNLSGGLQLDETNLITTTAIGSGSTASNVWYSTSAITTASQYRVIGLVNATWTSGTGWSSPTLVQPVSATASILLSSMFLSSLGSNGWKKYPDASSPTGYFIEQWGYGTTGAGGSVTVNRPVVYPNSVLWQEGSLYMSQVNSPYIVGTDNGSVSQLTLWACSTSGAGQSSVTIKWRSIGY